MPVTLTIKEVPDDLAQRLRERAALNHRSLQGELMSIVAAAVNVDAAQEERVARLMKSARRLGNRSIDEVVEECRRIMPPWEERFGRSVDIIREMRDRE